MNNKKKALIIVAFACVSFAIAAFFSLYKPAIEKITQKEREAQVVEEITGDLPRPVCDLDSDQKSYRNAVISKNINQCECIEDAELKNACKTESKDILLYEQALGQLDGSFCEKINRETQKNACIKAVENMTEKLSSEDPGYLANLFVYSHDERAITTIEEIVSQGHATIDEYISLAFSYAEKALKEQEGGNEYISYTQKAFENIQKAKALDPQNSEVYRAEGYVNEIVPDYNESINSYTRAIELDSQNYLAYAGRGHAYRLMGVLDVAVEDLNTAAQIDQGNEAVFIYTNLCNLEYTQGNSEAAIKNCKIVIGHSEGDPVFRSEAYQILSMIYISQSDFDLARNMLLTAQTLAKNDPNIFVSFSKLNFAQKNYERAEQDARSAIDVVSTKSTAYLALARALYMQERFDEAISAAKRGVELVSDDVSLLVDSKKLVARDLNYTIANAYRQLGNSEEQKKYEESATNDSFRNFIE